MLSFVYGLLVRFASTSEIRRMVVVYTVHFYNVYSIQYLPLGSIYTYNMDKYSY
jgi:hypothetical protein